MMNDTFSQKTRQQKNQEGRGGGGQRMKFQKGGISNIGGLHKIWALGTLYQQCIPEENSR